MRILITAAILIAMPFGFSAKAQLILHNGSDTPAGGGTSAPAGAASAAAAAPAKPKSIPMKLPGEDSIIGHDLLRNGAAGTVSFSREGKDLSVAKLSFEGEQSSKPGEACHVDVKEGLPLVAHFIGRPEGLTRYHVDLQACPFSFDVLEGAVFIPSGQACDFPAADCHVDPAGLWGPQGNTISATRAKEMEQARVRIESEMRANFRVLLSRAGKDKFAIKKIAGEQAGFSSERETLCHAYAMESVHGFCALEITRARVLGLLAQLGSISDKEETPKPRAKKRPKPPAMATQPPAPGE